MSRRASRLECRGGLSETKLTPRNSTSDMLLKFYHQFFYHKLLIGCRGGLSVYNFLRPFSRLGCRGGIETRMSRRAVGL